MTRLTDESLLQLTGPDAARFLQGQTTAHFEAASSGDTLRGAFCDPKGRVLADFLATVRQPNDIILRMRSDVAQQLQRHLQRYLAFSKATLTTMDWVVSASHHDDTAKTGVSDDVITIERSPQLMEYWSTAKAAPGTLDPDAFHTLEIKASEARIEAETIGLYLPQDLNFDLNGAVSFDKGCYTGQEIVARLHYRGTPKRRLYRAGTNAGSRPQPAQPLRHPDQQRSLGSIVNVAGRDGDYELLIEATEQALQGPLVIGDTGAMVRPR